MSENKTNTNETENNVVENTTAETQNQNIEVEDSGDTLLSAIPKKTSRRATNLLQQRQTAAHQTFTIG